MLNVNRFPDCLSRMMSVRTSPNLVEFVFIDNSIVGRGDLNLDTSVGNTMKC